MSPVANQVRYIMLMIDFINDPIGIKDSCFISLHLSLILTGDIYYHNLLRACMHALDTQNVHEQSS